MRILVATDGSPFSRTTLDYVVRLAGAIPLEIDLALVVDFHKIAYKMIAEQYVEMIREGAKATAERVLRREAEYLKERGVTATERILYGDPATALCEASTEGKFDLLVLGRRGHGDLQDVLFGSVSNQVIHHCSTPALVFKKDVPLAPSRGPVRVLAAIDGSRGAEDCLDLLARAGAPGAFAVTLLSVVNPESADLDSLPGELRYEALRSLHAGAEAVLDQAAASLEGFSVNRRVEEGRPGPTICRVAQESDQEIVLVGRRGTGELEDVFFGSVSHYVLHHSPCHVLLVP